MFLCSQNARALFLALTLPPSYAMHPDLRGVISRQPCRPGFRGIRQLPWCVHFTSQTYHGLDVGRWPPHNHHPHHTPRKPPSIWLYWIVLPRVQSSDNPQVDWSSNSVLAWSRSWHESSLGPARLLSLFLLFCRRSQPIWPGSRLSITIWGRCCSFQALLHPGVIYFPCLPLKERPWTHTSRVTACQPHSSILLNCTLVEFFLCAEEGRLPPSLYRLSRFEWHYCEKQVPLAFNVFCLWVIAGSPGLYQARPSQLLPSGAHPWGGWMEDDI